MSESESVAVVVLWLAANIRLTLVDPLVVTSFLSWLDFELILLFEPFFVNSGTGYFLGRPRPLDTFPLDDDSLALVTFVAGCGVLLNTFFLSCGVFLIFLSNDESESEDSKQI